MIIPIDKTKFSSLVTEISLFNDKQFITDWLFISAYLYYLARTPWGSSSQGMQDYSGAKSANWLAGWLSLYLRCRLLFQFYFLSTSLRQAGFLCAAAQLSKSRIPVNCLVALFENVQAERRESFSNACIASIFDVFFCVALKKVIELL